MLHPAHVETDRRAIDATDLVVGEQMWNSADFATSSGIMRVGGNEDGPFTRDRQQTTAAYRLRACWAGGPITKRG